jgi:putative NIF3 family GTP cyclohydrolase 1 type 2
MAITAQGIVARIQQKLGSGWRDSSVDTFIAGNRDSEVKGIVTTYAPSVEVLHKAVAAGKNMIISRESPFWSRPNSIAPGGTGPGGVQPGPPGFQNIVRPAAGPGGANAGRAGGGAAGAQGAPDAAGARGGGRGQSMDNDPVYTAKRDYIAANNLIVYRLFENWNARQPDPQLLGLLKALGWDKNFKPPEGVPWATHNAAFVTIPPSTLKEAAQNIKKTLKSKTIRVVGEPETRVSKAAVSHGISLLVDLERYVAEPGVDLVIIGEPIWENEGTSYFFDIVASGQKKGLVILGQEVSSEPGCGEMATWLKSFVSEVPVEWIPTGEPSWMPF